MHKKLHLRILTQKKKSPHVVKSAAGSVTRTKTCGNEKASKTIGINSITIVFYYELSHDATKNSSILLPIIEESLLQDVGKKLFDCEKKTNVTNRDRINESRFKNDSVVSVTSSISSDPVDSLSGEKFDSMMC